ncbi:pyridoxal phosphate-dependent aminotransferase [Myxacorys almedinensis]|uniref:Pyridoxal phosphate-dependent aminotransferase n=1 Tax=Myxacorys almedinensis A TaxID=2690445 RepID=A0A8J7Z6M9_9CYAN|nr:pyridoxal phosphate-dependent aminotransferase [Myxacorys almedinensis]NDJ19141.1 pyridoxal phosphate-dependent aminotransferase [Myxacorys almedinensis A]
MRQALRMQSVQLPMIPIVGELIRQHPGTISLGQGVVSYPPPPQAIAQISKFLSQPNNHKYQAVEGIAALRSRIAQKLQTENGMDVSAQNIVVTAGSNMGFLNAILAITDPGDDVILQAPYYFNHEMAIAIASCRAIVVPTDEHHQLQCDRIRQAITEKTRAIVTISPNNPTGAVYSEADLRTVNQLCQQHHLYHISDETYEYFTYGVPHVSPGSPSGSGNHTISLFSLSKAYGFASWRIGYMVVPAHLLESIQKIQDTNVICPAVISQYAALGALEAGKAYCQEKIAAIAEVRDIVLQELSSISQFCTVPPAHGAFYFLLNVQTDLSSMEVVERLICEDGVAVLPGSTFGLETGCYLRVAYGALDRDTAIAGVGRLIRGLKRIF